MITHVNSRFCVSVAGFGLIFSTAGVALGDWQSRWNPIDQPAGSAELTWRSTAANLLAGAGYGVGRSGALRAGSIYDQLGSYVGTPGAGEAMSWWLEESGHNLWAGNPFRRVVTRDLPSLGSSAPLGALGNEIRQGNHIGLNLDLSSGQDRSVTLWGDSGTPAGFAPNTGPSSVRVTDGADGVNGAVSRAVTGSDTISYPGGDATVMSYTGLLRQGGILGSTPLTETSSIMVTAPRVVGEGLASSYVYLVREDSTIDSVYALDVTVSAARLSQRQHDGQPTPTLNTAIHLGEDLSRDSHFLGYMFDDELGQEDWLFIPQTVTESSTELTGVMGFGRTVNPGWTVWQPVAQVVVPIWDTFTIHGEYATGLGDAGGWEFASFTSLTVVMTPEPGGAMGALLIGGVLMRRRNVPRKRGPLNGFVW